MNIMRGKTAIKILKETLAALVLIAPSFNPL